ncbi:MAG: glycoside hydrolase family 3 C-terminal domain-containing protein, partial [Candidatus Omnitrophica bacterium]|nr:glycoside hydrolase family 3 C-terminal domain-containing protein [Candidatus Omnitrophota bacterium]
LENIREGRVSMSLVDRSVRRILRQKMRLGLFEHPYTDPQHAALVVHHPAHRELALRAARSGIVLLKNDGSLLPLKNKPLRIAIIGPNADEPRNQLGDYVPAKVLQPVITVLDGIKQAVSKDTKVVYVKGCDVIGSQVDEIAKATEAAANADIAIVVVGENARELPGKPPTDGEGYDAATLELTGLQEDLVKAVVATGTPSVAVLINGRPLAVRWLAEHVPAILEAWLPGEMGGQAVAEILFGRVNPSGRLPVTIPRHAGQLPVYYNARKSKLYWVKQGWGHSYADLDPSPLYPFGFGMSYTRFEYRGLKLSQHQVTPTEPVEISLEVKNAGDRPGEEVVQLYIEDVISSVSTPVKDLKGFRKVALEPGETRTCSFKLEPKDLALLDANLTPVVEPGQFRIMVGASSEDIRLTGDLWVIDR